MSWGDRARHCEQGSDCVLSADIDGACCPEVCVATHAYNKTFAAALGSRREAACKSAQCPIVKCPAPKTHAVVECVKGACEVRSVVNAP